MKKLLFKLILLWEELFGPLLWSTRWANYQTYRQLLGGYWGLWEINWGPPFKMWYPSPCEHFPRLPLTTSTEPILTESYPVNQKYIHRLFGEKS
jgi:hypothetical protein